MNLPTPESLRLWSVKRTAELTDLPEQTVRDLIARGELTASRCGRRVMVHPDSVEALIARSKTSQQDPA